MSGTPSNGLDASAAADSYPGTTVADTVFTKLGSITRQLHDALNELGHTPKLQGTVQELPDVRSRLDYIAHLTGEAAEKVLNLVDDLKLKQALIAERAQQLENALGHGQDPKSQQPELVQWVRDIALASRTSDEQLTQVMLAQDFHDLTGQVVQRVVRIAGNIEDQLLELLLDSAPAASDDAPASKELGGPVIPAQARSDVAVNQDQVDSLLASLGF